MSSHPASRRLPFVPILLLPFIIQSIVPAVATYAGQGLSTVKLIKIGSASAASLSGLAAEARKIGVELPPFLTATGIEERFPFVGPGGLDIERPIGLEFFAGPDTDLAQGQGIVFLLPVKRDAATLKSFFDFGGKAVAGSPGMVELNGSVFRRTAGYLIFSPTAKATSGVRETDLTDLYKGRTGGVKGGADQIIIRAALDVTAFRQAAPQKFQSIINQAKLAALLKGVAATPAVNFALDFVQEITRLDIAVVKSGEDLGLKVGVTPIRVPAGGTYPKPGMPQEVILRFDMGAPPLKVLPWAEVVLRQLEQTGVAGSVPRAAPAQQPPQGDLPHQIADILLAGQAMSVGIAPRDNFAVLYVVQQHVAADPAARLKQLSEQFNLGAAYAADKAKASRIELTQYSGDRGIKITRACLFEGKACKFCIDCLRRGDTVFMAGSTDQGRYLSSLIDLPPTGQFSGLINGSLNLAAALAIIQDGAANAIPSPQLKKLHEILKDRYLTLSATGEPDEVVFGLSLPEALVKDLVGFYYDAVGGNPPAGLPPK